MKQREDVHIFYQQYLEKKPVAENSFQGYFDTFSWQQLKDDLSACDQLQRKPFYKIALLRGEARYHANEEEIHVNGHTIVFIDPMTRCRFTTHDQHFAAEYCVFSESFLRGSGKIAVANWPVFAGNSIYTQSLTDQEYEHLRHIFHELETEHQSAYQFKEEVIRNRIFDVIHFVQKMAGHRKKENDVQDEKLTTLFFTNLEHIFFNISPDRPLEHKTPAGFAQLLHVTIDKLNKTLRKTTGKTTQSLLHERILQEANVLLRHTSYSIKEIAWCLKFQETAHFQNFYKKHAGCTPVEYRQA
ncbi:helix-turn-helix domain-containing protein [Chitinophaga nivalis]|uniref:Helix-turn-helix transcriptional regulator n=1 Tax=Chitinophaga nivalis TaxID=2991709 RepID=A0ABT3IK61_9BACT|nr:helix-turn-helix transcriptional regulator [Chitinophaga nivalis]MCW3465966.1 helix-turn-helix transcriptional regulator [Chitinophaga nivalis]MCW3484343.1 helix-turn-helix transcriptional regulator [Chitinophaga nivalis]